MTNRRHSTQTTSVLLSIIRLFSDMRGSVLFRSKSFTTAYAYRGRTASDDIRDSESLDVSVEFLKVFSVLCSYCSVYLLVSCQLSRGTSGVNIGNISL